MNPHDAAGSRPAIMNHGAIGVVFSRRGDDLSVPPLWLHAGFQKACAVLAPIDVVGHSDRWSVEIARDDLSSMFQSLLPQLARVQLVGFLALAPADVMANDFEPVGGACSLELCELVMLRLQAMLAACEEGDSAFGSRGAYCEASSFVTAAERLCPDRLALVCGSRSRSHFMLPSPHEVRAALDLHRLGVVRHAAADADAPEELCRIVASERAVKGRRVHMYLSARTWSVIVQIEPSSGISSVRLGDMAMTESAAGFVLDLGRDADRILEAVVQSLIIEVEPGQ